MRRSLAILFALPVLLSGQQPGEDQLVPPTLTAAQRAEKLYDNIQFQVRGNNAFGTALYGRLRSRPGNLFFSPYSVTSAVALAYAGAAGGTQVEMQGVMHYLSDRDDLFNVFATLNKKLSTAWVTGPNESRLYLANSIWFQRDLKLLPKYLDTVNVSFKSSLQKVDFARNPDGARLNINTWVREKTQGRIRDLINPGDIDTSTRMVLVSSIFMKAVWQNAFDPSLTATGTFFRSQNSSTSAKMMTRSATFPYYDGGSFQALELPYRTAGGDDPQFSMLILLPHGHGIEELEKSLTVDLLEVLLRGLAAKQVIASIPKFSFLDEFRLDQTLEAMGMQTAFSPYANFSDITGSANLAMGTVLHKAFIDVDEKGTEAVAATAVTINLTSVIPDEAAIVFRADHPFVFLILDRSTNSILFMGRLEAP